MRKRHSESAQIRGKLRSYKDFANPEPSCRKAEGVETGRAVPKSLLIKVKVKGQSSPQTPFGQGGYENNSGMNPGVVGSNPAADTID